MDIGSSSALVTVAMLSTLLNERNTDYLDLISPFVCSLLPQAVGKEVDKGEVILGLRDVYGFAEFPMHVLTKILERNAKSNRKQLVRRDGRYYVHAVFDSDGFSRKKDLIKRAQNNVMAALQAYLQRNTRYTGITLDATQDIFAAFLERCGLSMLGGVGGLRSLVRRDYDDYHVGRFVLAEHAAKSAVFGQIEEVVRGYFVYAAIYYFSRAQKKTFDSKLRGTTVYFDTKLLIEALGYNTREGKRAARELIALIREAGGVVKTFAHLEDEVAGILRKYATDPVARSSMTLALFDDAGYTETEVLRLHYSMRIQLQKLGIEVDDARSILGKQVWGELGGSELGAALQAARAVFNARRTDNDVASVLAVRALRDDAVCVNIESCKAILATSNQPFVRTVREFYSHRADGEISEVMEDVDLTALLWLRSWDKKGDVPTGVLLENAYAACQPSPALIEAFAQTVARMQQAQEITYEEALLLRTQRAPRDALLAAAQNDPGCVSKRMVLELRDEYNEMLVADVRREADALKMGLEKERKIRSEENNRALEKAYENADALASAERARVYKWLRRLAFALFLGFLGVGAAAVVFSSALSEGPVGLKVLSCAVGIVGLLDSLRGRSGWCDRLISRAAIRRFDAVYERECGKIQEYFAPILPQLGVSELTL